MRVTFTRLHNFIALAPTRRALMLRIWCSLGCYRLALPIIPFKYLAPRLAASRFLNCAKGLPAGGVPQATELGELVARIANCTPWQSTCLVQVLVLQRLLRVRGISGRLHLGVRRPDRCETDSPGGATPLLAGHAWVQCGDTVVIGARNYREYEIIATFAW